MTEALTNREQGDPGLDLPAGIVIKRIDYVRQGLSHIPVEIELPLDQIPDHAIETINDSIAWVVKNIGESPECASFNSYQRDLFNGQTGSQPRVYYVVKGKGV